MKLSYNPPKILKRSFDDFIWQSKTDKVLLTFDDGPNSETTDIILNKLKVYNVKALFFCVGENIIKYPESLKRIVNEGHLVGNHTFSHKDVIGLNTDHTNYQIGECSKIILEATGNSPKYFRPPHGRFDLKTNRILKNHDLTNVMWSLLTYDYKNDLNIVKFAVQKYLTNNSIILLHDSNKSKKIIESSIDFIIGEAKRNGFKFGTPSECLN